MLSPKSIASVETARALEIRYEREYKGRTFVVGESIMVDEVEIKTHPTGHTIGSTAFSWTTETGERVLVTGDVKDFSALPRCNYLVTEANYGDPMILLASSRTIWQASLKPWIPAPALVPTPLAKRRELWRS